MDLAEDLAEAKEYAAVPLPEMEALIQDSDRTRHATLITDLSVIDAHKDLVLRPQLHQLAEQSILWLGTDCRMLRWSLHLEPHLYMETSLTPVAESSARQLQGRLESQLDVLPERLLSVIRGMQPQTSGHRRIIGRFPAMMQGLVLGTQVTQISGAATLSTVLPQKAAASLAAGATLTWNESARTTDRPSVAEAASPPPSSRTVAERLRLPLLIDFRRTPLHEALSYIAGEIRVPARIDGDALKIAGLTQNMAQTHNLGEVPALQALDTILQQYDGIMVIVVNESQGQLLLTTREAAIQQGLTVYETSGEPEGSDGR